MSPSVVLWRDHPEVNHHQERGAAWVFSAERGTDLPWEPKGVPPGAALGAGCSSVSSILLLKTLCWQIFPGKHLFWGLFHKDPK